MDDIIPICMHCGCQLEEMNNPGGFVGWVRIDKNPYCHTNAMDNNIPLANHEPLEKWMIQVGEIILIVGKLING